MKFTTKKMTVFFTMLSMVTLSFASFGQGENLVPNPSFESTDKKPKRLGSIESTGNWVSPTGARADLFIDTKVEEIATPLNIYGKEDAKEGSNYAGVVGFSYGGKMPRTYVMAKLDAPLKKGMMYCVKFNVSLAEASKYACNNMGALLSKKPFSTDSKLSIIEEPTLLHFSNDTKILSARFNWTEICGMIEAEGGEKYITIGNFISDEETKNERMKKAEDVKVAQIAAAYYYIDNVSVQLIDTEKGEICDCAAEEAGDSYSTTIYQKVFNVTDDMTAKDKIELQQVYFAFGKNKLSTEGMQSLDLIAAEMKANPEMKLQINGHNNEMEDEVGMENDYYADMDNKRISAVMEYLGEKGIDQSRMLPTQKGSEMPNTEVSEEDDEDLTMAKSRRVTFKVR